MFAIRSASVDMDYKPIRFAPLTLLSSSLSPAADAQPTDAEREVWDQVDVVLKDAKGILDELQAYKGAGKEIREVRPKTNIPPLTDSTQLLLLRPTERKRCSGSYRDLIRTGGSSVVCLFPALLLYLLIDCTLLAKCSYPR